jgi:hypothetical protein
MTNHLKGSLQDYVLLEVAKQGLELDAKTIDSYADKLFEEVTKAGRLAGNPAGDWVRKQINDRKPPGFKPG